MGLQESDKLRWGGWLWMVALIAFLLTVIILLILFPRPLAWTSPPPTSAPWTPRPGLYEIPTVPPSPTPEGALPLSPLLG